MKTENLLGQHLNSQKLILSLFLSSFAIHLSSAALAKTPWLPPAEDCDITARQEALTEWRLLARDIKFHAVPRDPRDINGETNVPCFQPPAEQVVNKHALIWETDRDPLDVLMRRTVALAEDVGRAGARPSAASLRSAVRTPKEELTKLQAQVKATRIDDLDARHALFYKVMALRRKIAFSNPLVKRITKLLFITRETPPPDESTWGVHMCDQYFGFHATLKGSTFGNGIYALENPFSDNPKLVNLAPVGTKFRCENPEWDNRTITRETGFLSPDVSFDGTEILFSWTPGEYRLREWDEKTTFHIMKMNADGSNLRMLTWGGVNDLFPCWLPSGRIMFVSERRGGFGRCHMRPVPNYTLHSMFPDGSDIVCLSPHETNEWEPSVDNDGMVVYSRWDYTDRGFNQAHHSWITYPDGRDPRELNGNTRTNQRVAPHMEQAVRAIPNSRKYVAIAVGHHVPERGSLVVIDPSVPDDSEMSQVKRLTPEVLLPEAEKMITWPIRPSGCYGAAWPLSETYYICTYDGMGNSQYSTTIDYQRRKYAITLLDAFGNRIRIYEHPTISCADPMPLMARKMPPIIPHKTLFGRPCDADGKRPQAIPEKDLPQEGLYAVMNVYNSRYPFPKDVKITALRIWQVLPKVLPYDGHARLGVIDQMPGRQCLGTVPVEADGSAYFKVPVKTPVYFQALDENGCAIQSMRTVAYAQSGERLTCNGCHESRHGRATPVSGGTPLALKRAPSTITPEVEGAKPYNYPRLVQGVLDAKCISCHAPTNPKFNAQKMPNLTKGDIYVNPYFFHTSFIDLMARGVVQYYTQFYCGTNWFEVGMQRDRFVQAYSEPGKVGAYASKLYQILKAGHHGVKLTPEEMRRLIVFMDSHGAYLAQDAKALAQCEGKLVDVVEFPPVRALPLAADKPLLVVGDSVAGAVAANTLGKKWRAAGEAAVLLPGKLTADIKALYREAPRTQFFEDTRLVRVLKGRSGVVNGVVFKGPDGVEKEARALVVFDGTGVGTILEATNAKKVNGSYVPGEGYAYAYRPQGSENVFVADACAAVPREEVPILLTRENQMRVGHFIGLEIGDILKGIRVDYTQKGR